jgi:hypothetical protein
MRPFVLMTCAACLLTSTAAAQTPTQTTRPRAVNHTAYSANTESFAEWVTFVARRIDTPDWHLTHTGDRLRLEEHFATEQECCTDMHDTIRKMRARLAEMRRRTYPSHTRSADSSSESGARS